MILPKYMFLITLMEMVLVENEMEVLNDAIQCYGRHPEDHSYAGEMDDIRSFARVFDHRGYNHVRPEFDILIPKANRQKEQKGIKVEWYVRFTLADGEESLVVLPSRRRLLWWMLLSIWRCRYITIFASDFYDGYE